MTNGKESKKEKGMDIEERKEEEEKEGERDLPSLSCK